MAVTTRVQPLVHPRATRSPRDPLGTWWATPNSAGDGTGGNHTVGVILARPALWSVEGIGLIGSVAKAVFLNFSPGRTGFGWTAQVTLVAAGGSFAAPNPYGLLGWRGLIVDPGPDGEAFMDAVVVNVNLETVELDSWGFTWDREALLTPGGPRRPRLTLFEPAGG